LLLAFSIYLLPIKFATYANSIGNFFLKFSHSPPPQNTKQNQKTKLSIKMPTGKIGFLPSYMNLPHTIQHRFHFSPAGQNETLVIINNESGFSSTFIG